MRTVATVLVLTTLSACGNGYAYWNIRSDRPAAVDVGIEHVEVALTAPVPKATANRRVFVLGIGPVIAKTAGIAAYHAVAATANAVELNPQGDDASTVAFAALNRSLAAAPVGRCDVRVRLVDAPWDADAYLTGVGEEKYAYWRDDADGYATSSFMQVAPILFIGFGVGFLVAGGLAASGTMNGPGDHSPESLGPPLLGVGGGLVGLGVLFATIHGISRTNANPHHLAVDASWKLRLTLRDAVRGRKSVDFEESFNVTQQTRSELYDMRFKADAQGWTSVSERLREIIGGLPACASN